MADDLLTSRAWIVHAQALRALPALVDALPETACFYRGRNRLYRCTLHDQAVVIKRFQVGGNLVKKLSARWGHGKALRTFRIAARLRSHGIATPEPLAALECRGADGALADSFYVSADAGAVPTLRQVRLDPTFPGRTALLEATGRLAGRLHAAGCDHRDLTPGNIVFARGGPCLVDLNRIRFHRVGAAAGLLRLLQLDVTPEDLHSVLAGYQAVRPELEIGSSDHAALATFGRWRLGWRALARLTRPWRRHVGA